MRLAAVVLEGTSVRLEPLDPRHFDAVLEAALGHPEIGLYSPVRSNNQISRVRLAWTSTRGQKVDVHRDTWASL